MTQKELDYVEDAIGHENNIIKICQETMNYLEDENLISFIDNELSNHMSMKEKLMNMMEAKSHD